MDLKNQHNEPDVMCLSETFLKAGNEKNVRINGYELATSFSRNQKRGGVCLLVKKNVSYFELKWLSQFARVKSFECCGIDIPSLKITIICVYRTPNSNVNIFIQKLDLMLHQLTERKSKYKVVIAGNFNINRYFNYK